jgi:hypothetical protein
VALPTAPKKLCPQCQGSFPADYLYCPDDGTALLTPPPQQRRRRLSEILKEEGVLRPAAACRLGAQIAAAMAEMHALALFYGDLAPWSVEVEERPGGSAIRILDFMDAAQEPGGRLPRSQFVAPEHREDQPDARGDLYSLGAIVHLMTLGRGPIAPPLIHPMTSTLLHRAGGSLETKRPASFPPALGELLDRLTDPDPARRPASAREAGEALAAIAAELEPRSFNWQPGEFVNDRYQLGAKLAEDDVAVRFAASDFPAFAEVELVVPRNSALSDAFYREGHRWLPVRHPGLEEVLDVGEAADGTPFLVVHPLGGSVLTSLLEPGRLSLPDAGSVLCAAARCLTTLHAAGLEYGDLRTDDVRVGTGRHPAAITAPWRPALAGRQDGDLVRFGKLISATLSVHAETPPILARLVTRLVDWEPKRRPSWEEVLDVLERIEWAPPAPPERRVVPGS